LGSGRQRDPLFRIGTLLLSGSEILEEHRSHRILLGLRVGHPHDEVVGP
jgi:hypothetical protein